MELGGKVIVCVCNNVSDREIRQAVELGCDSMEELARDLGVGSCCGMCHACAKEELNSAKEVRWAKAANGSSWPGMLLS